MRIGNLTAPATLWLAPMAGVTDFAFRTVCAELGAQVCVTEMVSSRALVYQDKKSRTLLRKNDGGLCGVQIFGNDPAIMADAAQIALELSGCDFIDVNMGCPMPKVCLHGDGSGLMRTPELAARIVGQVVQAVRVPVTVKMRTGWDKSSVNCVQLAQMVQDAGAAAVAVHGRTRTMLYSGVADWDMIRKVKQAVQIPVIANGDITDHAAALRCLARTQADGLMVGRSCFGDPWIFSQVLAALEGRPQPEPVPLARRMDVAERQFQLAMEDRGERAACLHARRHFAWYLRGVAHSGYYKRQIAQVETMEQIRQIAEGIRRDLV